MSERFSIDLRGPLVNVRGSLVGAGGFLVIRCSWIPGGCAWNFPVDVINYDNKIFDRCRPVPFWLKLVRWNSPEKSDEAPGLLACTCLGEGAGVRRGCEESSNPMRLGGGRGKGFSVRRLARRSGFRSQNVQISGSILYRNPSLIILLGTNKYL